MKPDTPFASDGCTLVPDFDFRHCCVEHDKAYWLGGTPRDRAVADRRLKACISRRHPFVGAVYYVGVRSFGHRFWPGNRKWGWAWSRAKYGWMASTQAARNTDIDTDR